MALTHFRNQPITIPSGYTVQRSISTTHSNILYLATKHAIQSKLLAFRMVPEETIAITRLTNAEFDITSAFDTLYLEGENFYLVNNHAALEFLGTVRPYNKNGIAGQVFDLEQISIEDDLYSSFENIEAVIFVTAPRLIGSTSRPHFQESSAQALEIITKQTSGDPEDDTLSAARFTLDGQYVLNSFVNIPLPNTVNLRTQNLLGVVNTNNYIYIGVSAGQAALTMPGSTPGNDLTLTLPTSLAPRTAGNDWSVAVNGASIQPYVDFYSPGSLTEGLRFTLKPSVAIGAAGHTYTLRPLITAQPTNVTRSGTELVISVNFQHSLTQLISLINANNSFPVTVALIPGSNGSVLMTQRPGAEMFGSQTRTSLHSTDAYFHDGHTSTSHIQPYVDIYAPGSLVYGIRFTLRSQIEIGSNGNNIGVQVSTKLGADPSDSQLQQGFVDLTWDREDSLNQIVTDINNQPFQITGNIKEGALNASLLPGTNGSVVLGTGRTAAQLFGSQTYTGFRVNLHDGLTNLGAAVDLAHKRINISAHNTQHTLTEIATAINAVSGLSGVAAVTPTNSAVNFDSRYYNNPPDSLTKFTGGGDAQILAFDRGFSYVPAENITLHANNQNAQTIAWNGNAIVVYDTSNNLYYYGAEQLSQVTVPTDLPRQFRGLSALRESFDVITQTLSGGITVHATAIDGIRQTFVAQTGIVTSLDLSAQLDHFTIVLERPVPQIEIDDYIVPHTTSGSAPTKLNSGEKYQVKGIQTGGRQYKQVLYCIKQEI